MLHTRFDTLLLSHTVEEGAISLHIAPWRDDVQLTPAERVQAYASGIARDSERLCLLPSATGDSIRVFVRPDTPQPEAINPWWLAALCDQLGEGTYRIANVTDPDAMRSGALGWCLAHYRFDAYRSDHKPCPERKLILPEGINIADILMEAHAFALVRDLINTPAVDMGPAALQQAVEGLASRYDAHCSAVIGTDLLDQNFPALHAVGRAAAPGREPRLIKLSWGDRRAPLVTLVGKGVCYDTGGLSLKPNQGMRHMKKDMGGAAHVIGLAAMIMAAKLPLRLELLIPAVENSVAGDAYRPGDIIQTRKGLTVEIGNTDAEGRVILCDALAFASERKPALMLDFATLTGAARIALGADVPAVFTNNDTVWHTLDQYGQQEGDPLWRLPLWQAYRKKLSSTVADLNNTAEGMPTGFAGAVTAALYLEHFVDADIPWAHIDLNAWQYDAYPGRPVGAAVQGMRAAFKTIQTILC